ncbi:D-3-phosphoglycerate dehydrogenase/(S)-sulfolactate dehydrogenase [Murinocardiopsis flavida]|uniref:D-3-phosphoglycerate dehydrogenase/(S)-sulfolactate dehydrogenase n=1 Tax=Murinocardiopsis flavida TaxID=645275 RepID=A0A2P8DTT7_9ACTN|nr:NAD(P)-dependent oxidoreductase [Murinocardiopsis flavida]PSL00636.1 D-3-phosphoglycerate dehydrogenase/(S)-sulfolactate dehydrogenase [Murinocardiopsis flavida]
MTTDVTVVEDVWGAAFDTLSARRDIRYLPDAWSDPAALRDAVRGTRALVVRNRTPVTRDLLAAAPDLRVVARAGVGLDNIDLAAAAEHGVVVAAALGANAVSVAEHTLGLALAVARRTVELDGAVRTGAWRRTPGRELAGGVWGTLSAGATARATLRLARGLGMRAIAYDPYLDPADPRLAELGCELHPLDRVLARSDVLSVHLPATPDTRGLLDARRIALMGEHAILVSAGRGEVVDEDALADALAAGRPAGAALDVRSTEPPVPGRLEAMANVVLTPHVAGITTDSQERIAGLLCADIDAVLAGGAARNAVAAATAGGPA